MSRLTKVLIIALLGLVLAWAAPSASAAPSSLSATPPLNLPAGAGAGGGGSGGPSTTPGSTATRRAAGSLPHTGIDVVAVAGCGLLLVLGGIALELGGARGSARRSRAGSGW